VTVSQWIRQRRHCRARPQTSRTLPSTSTVVSIPNLFLIEVDLKPAEHRAEFIFERSPAVMLSLIGIVRNWRARCFALSGRAVFDGLIPRALPWANLLAPFRRDQMSIVCIYGAKIVAVIQRHLRDDCDPLDTDEPSLHSR
jgi:hypothetical protein